MHARNSSWTISKIITLNSQVKFKLGLCYITFGEEWVWSPNQILPFTFCWTVLYIAELNAYSRNLISYNVTESNAIKTKWFCCSFFPFPSVKAFWLYFTFGTFICSSVSISLNEMLKETRILWNSESKNWAWAEIKINVQILYKCTSTIQILGTAPFYFANKIFLIN